MNIHLILLDVSIVKFSPAVNYHFSYGEFNEPHKQNFAQRTIDEQLLSMLPVHVMI